MTSNILRRGATDSAYFMNAERVNALVLFFVFLPTGIVLGRLAKNPEATRAGRTLTRALDSWFWRTRWSDAPEVRIRRMSWLSIAVALIMSWFAIFAETLRYRS